MPSCDRCSAHGNQHRPPDLIASDVVVPKIDRQALIRALRSVCDPGLIQSQDGKNVTSYAIFAALGKTLAISLV